MKNFILPSVLLGLIILFMVGVGAAPDINNHVKDTFFIFAGMMTLIVLGLITAIVRKNNVR